MRLFPCCNQCFKLLSLLWLCCFRSKKSTRSVKQTCSNYKVTVIWAPQSGMSAEGANHRVRPQARAIEGPTWGSGGVSWAPQWGPGIASAASDFSYVQVKSELIFGHLCISIQLWRWANRDNSGTPSQKRDKWASQENCDFFPGLIVKNQEYLQLSKNVLFFEGPDHVWNNAWKKVEYVFVFVWFVFR